MKVIRIILTSLIIILSACNTTGYKNLQNGMYADIQTDKGTILLQLEYENTPITVANFISLAEGTNTYVNENFKGKPFYNGLKFHRVMKDFMVQGGDPEGTGAGGPGYVFEDEFPVNDSAKLLLPHNKAGILSMANHSRPTTNGSQFFITHKPTPWLDNIHTVFGHVVEGQNVVDSIAANDVMNVVKIIRIGKDAKSFNAAKIFDDYFKGLEAEAKLKLEKLDETKKEFLSTFESNMAKAKTLPSNLKIFITEEGTGVKPVKGVDVRINYAVYFTDGSLIASSYKSTSEKFGKYDPQAEQMGVYNPFTMPYSEEATLVPGFREAMLNMNYGDKAMLFVPSHLGYGPQGKNNIPPNTDLIFEMEIVNQQN